MAVKKRRSADNPNEGATLGYEETLWRAAEGLRGHIEPAEYKHIVLGLLFLKFVSDNSIAAPWTGRPAARVREGGTDTAIVTAGSARFVVPQIAKWKQIEAAATHNSPARALQAATNALEEANPSLSGLLDFGLRRVSAERLSRLVLLLGGIALDQSVSGSRDVFGRVYEYFLAKFASVEGRSGGEYYTPRSVVRLLVEMLHPFHGTVYDPCCGTAGMFVQSDELVKEHGQAGRRVQLYGQESSATTWRLARLNLAVRGLQADLGARHADSFAEDLHKDLKADFILANPPFNLSDWGANKLAGDARWIFGEPPASNANYAWIQHIFAHLAPDGLAGFVLANGSLSSDQSGEGRLRRALVDADVVECIVALPSQLFYGTQIPACLWFISPHKTRGGAEELKNRTLFVDARHRGHLVDRTHAELGADDVAAISATFLSWRKLKTKFRSLPGFAASATTSDIRRHQYALVPGRYVGFLERPDANLGLSAVATELREVRSRLQQVAKASRSALAVIESMSHV